MVMKIAVSTLFFLTLLFSAPAFAGDSSIDPSDDPLFGGVIGRVLGIAIMVVSDGPEEAVENVFEGTVAGLSSITNGSNSDTVPLSASEGDSDELKLQLPTIETKKIYYKHTDMHEVVWKLDLFRYEF